MRAFIEEEQFKLVEVVPYAVENVKKLVKEMKKMHKKEQKGVSFPIRQVPMSSRGPQECLAIPWVLKT